MKNTIVIVFLFVIQISFAQKTLSNVEKLASTCKVWGFLKYYHPEVASGKFNWDNELFEILPKISEAKNKQEFSLVIENWIDKLGKVRCISPIKDNDSINYFYKNLDLTWISNSDFFSAVLSNKLKYIKNNRWQDEQFYVSVPVDNGIADPVIIQNELRQRDINWTDLSLRLLTLFKYWNIINYFHPYKYLMDVNWDKSLVGAIPEFINVQSEKDFHNAITNIVVRTNDGHASYFPEFEGQPELGTYFIPAIYKFIDNKLVITKILNDSLAAADDIQLGDAIERIDKTIISDFINENKKSTPSSNYSAYLEALTYKISPFVNQKIEIEFLRNSTRKINTISLYSAHDFHRDRNLRKEVKFKILANNIGYINLVRIKKTDLDSLFSFLKNTKAIIFDIRNYPLISEDDLSPYFQRNNNTFVMQTFADTKFPGRFIYEKAYGGQLNVESKPKYLGKIIVLVNEVTHSHAEWLGMFFKTIKNATVIGSQTSGADGGISSYEITIPFKTTFSGKGVYYPNGKETQRIGIERDIEVKATIAGIQQGKDEILERAIEFINTEK